MSSFDDMSQYLGVFLDEAEEQLQMMSEGLVKLEQSGSDQTLLNQVFRAAHTIKGASASMGFDKMAHLTHEMENLLDRVRSGEMDFNRELVDTLLECLDTLELLKSEISDGDDRQIEIDDLVAKLQRFDGEIAGANSTPSSDDSNFTNDYDEVERNLLNSARKSDFNTFNIKVELASDCQMKSVRAYLVFNNLEELGEVIKTIPSTEEIEDEKFDYSFELVFISQANAAQIRDMINSISEIENVTVQPIHLDNYDVSENEAKGLKEKSGIENESKAQQTKAAAAAAANRKVSQTVRVDVKRLESLMNLVGELVIDRTRLADVGISIKEHLGGHLAENMEEISTHIGRITTDLQEEIMKARMLPIERVFNRFPRMVRDLAKKAGKEINFVVEGQETELDRTVIEEITDPLIHLLRNCVDHGIENHEKRIKTGKPAQGIVKLNAFHEENQIVITVSDDGGGIDPEKVRQKAIAIGIIDVDVAARMPDQEVINLIFYPGFSTASEVSDVSGRGVGMDIVRAHIERINGRISIDTSVGKGTTFNITLPLTLAINRSLLVQVCDSVLAFPLVNVVEIINVEQEKIYSMQKRQVTLVRGHVLPLFSLAKVLGWETKSKAKESSKLQVVVAGISEKKVGFVVDGLLGEQEIVIKSLGEYIGQVPGLAGTTIMGDGKVALILDIRGLVEQTGAINNYGKAN
ncbi:chemotaxis protein CheA [Metallumcola ferriviriculae]|uniref:Chemotaxis protein CheA n=1 Tax=Metallumcola ferriviriculae TaxID=3039180 RepID=A0AAU0UTL9_9FIRM|nr:chemotaxis protein CheA [Desulfitibacteraceae bacterium MK1]